jgi:hypothetical protein
VGRTFYGALATAATSLINRTPVPYAPSTGRAGLGSGLLRPAGQEAQMRAMGGSAPCSRSSTGSSPRTPK